MLRIVVLCSVVAVVLMDAITLGAASVAGAQEASPVAAETSLEPLFETTVPAESLPSGPGLIFLIWYATIAPGVDVTVPDELLASSSGPQLEHVLAGELTLRVDGPLQVVRASAGGTPGPEEGVPPGTEVTLRAGDTAVYAWGVPIVYANRGAEPVHLASGGVFDGAQAGSGPGYLVNNYDAVSPMPSLPSGPITLTLEQATLAPGAMLPGAPPGAVRAVTSGPKVAYLPEASDGSVSNVLREPVMVYVLTLTPAGPESGTPEATPTV